MMQGGIMFNQKDIVLIPFPYSDLTGAKQRPALIISNELINNQDKICCLITSNSAIDGLEIKNEHFKNGKLPFKSWVKPHRIFTIDSRIIKKKLCSINQNFHREIVKTLNKYFD